jgi:hypothetical protein
MKKLAKKLANEAHALIWTVAGTALVLITLSGSVQQTAIQISGLALIFHIFGVLIKKDSNND